MAIYRVFISGLVISPEGLGDPAGWDLLPLIEEATDLEVQTRKIKDSKAWPEPVRKKRAYTCSHCEGRHAVRHCPELRKSDPKGGTK